MSFFEYLDSLKPEFCTFSTEHKLSNPRIKYGFSTNITVTYSDSHGTDSEQRPYVYFANEVTLLGLHQAVIQDEVPIYDGVRRELINTEGLVDTGLVRSYLMRSTLRRRLTTTYLDKLESEGMQKNAISLAYNLLRMFYLKLYEEVNYNPEGIYFDNGHVRIFNRQMFGTTAGTLCGHSIHVNHLCRLETDDLTESSASNSIAWENCMSQIELNIILVALSAWEQVGPFSLAHSSPGLVDEIRINASRKVLLEEQIPFERFTLFDIFGVIRHVINANKLFTDFDYAYMMVCQVLVNPVSRTAESAAWLLEQQIVGMPRLRIFSGEYNQMFWGKAYARDNKWKSTYQNWATKPKMALFHAICLTEAVHVELRNVSRMDASAEVNITNFVDLAIMGNPVQNAGIIVDLALISMRNGREKIISYPISGGLTRHKIHNPGISINVLVTISDRLAAEHHNLMGDLVVGKESTIVVTTTCPSFYPTLTMGVDVEKYNSRALQQEVTVNLVNADEHGIVFTDVNEFYNFMNITRITGFDVRARDIVNDKWTTNWADDTNDFFFYNDFDNKCQTYFVVAFNDIVKRQNDGKRISTFQGVVTMSIKLENAYGRLFIDTKTLIMYGSPSKPHQIIDPLIETTSPKVAAKMMKIMPLDLPQRPDMFQQYFPTCKRKQ